MADTGMLNSWYDDYMKSTPSAQGYTAEQAKTTDWNVDKNQTVQGQIEGVINKGGPLMTQATTAANQASARRGMLASTMGIQAGQAALYGAAMPIATADASTYSKAASQNADAANTNARFNVDQTNQAARFTADANNQATAQQRDAGIRGGLQAQEQNWQSGENKAQREWGTSERVAGQEFTAGENKLQREFTSGENQKTRDFTTSEREAGQDFTSGENQKQRAFTTSEREAGQDFTAGQNQEMRAFQTSERVAGQQFTASQNNAQQAFQMAYQQADLDGKKQLAAIDGDVRKEVANITGKYNTLMQASSSAGSTFNAMNNGIAAILTDPNMDYATKQSAINSLIAATNNTLSIQSKITGLDLGEMDTMTVSSGTSGSSGNSGSGTNTGGDVGTKPPGGS